VLKKSYVILFAIILNSNLVAEPSAFDAGVIDSDNPYGLSESERVIVENKKRSLQNKKSIQKQSIILDQLQERVEGLSSVVDSLSSKFGQTSQKLSQFEQDRELNADDQISKLQKEIDELRADSEKKYKKINATLQKLISLMGGKSSKSSEKVSHSQKAITKKSKKVSSSQLINEAIKAYREKNYAKAESKFRTLAKRSYMPAKTNYYLGEIAYYQKRYDDAIAFYKKSVGYYDKASYMPKLLLHTALSFKGLGEKDNANEFFNTLIDSYPDSMEASIAQKYLN